MTQSEKRMEAPPQDAVPALGRRAYSPAEACEILGVGRTFLYDQIAAKKLESIRVGGRRLNPERAIRKFLGEK